MLPQPIALVGSVDDHGIVFDALFVEVIDDAFDVVINGLPWKYDLIVTDMTMPHMTGAELARKAMEIRSDFPVILCTGHSDLIDADAALAMGIKKYCEKPLSVKTLLQTVRLVLDEAEIHGTRVLLVDDVQANAAVLGETDVTATGL